MISPTQTPLIFEFLDVLRIGSVPAMIGGRVKTTATNPDAAQKIPMGIDVSGTITIEHFLIGFRTPTALIRSKPLRERWASARRQLLSTRLVRFLERQWAPVASCFQLWLSKPQNCRLGFPAVALMPCSFVFHARVSWPDPNLTKGSAMFTLPDVIVPILTPFATLVTNPTCEHGNLMQYVRTDVLTENYVYVRAQECDGLADCLRRGANPPPLGYSVHGNEVWIDPKTDPWVFGYPYRHGSEEFGILYLYRLVVERSFGEMKKPGRQTGSSTRCGSCRI